MGDLMEQLDLPGGNVINVITPDSSLCLSDSDESVSDLLRVDAQITPEHIAYQKDKSNLKPDPIAYCVPACKHDRKEGTASMTRCCQCMTWYHMSCLDEDEEEGEAYWTCHICRQLPDKVNALCDKVNNLYMKLDDMYHLNTKLLGVVEKSNRENKLLRQQINAMLTSDKKSSHVKSVHQTLSTSNVTHNNAFVANKSVNVKEKNVEVSDDLDSSHNVRDLSSVCGKENEMGKNLVIICDSIPTYIDKTVVNKKCGMNTEILKTAESVNEAVDYIQDRVNPEAMTVIHTGTRNLRKDSPKTVIQRFQRLETNIKEKKLKKVALSGIVHRTDRNLWEKIIVINKAIKSICVRNKWCYIDNDNVDNACLWKDGLHLNKIGKTRLAQNIANSVLHFRKASTHNLF